MKVGRRPDSPWAKTADWPVRLDPAPVCPNCGVVLNGAAEVKGNPGSRPAAGDVGICFCCCTVLGYAADPLRDGGLRLVPILGDELILTLAAFPVLRELMARGPVAPPAGAGVKGRGRRS
jgi:hypothetical protein